MPLFSPKQLAQWSGGVWDRTPPGSPITGVSHDTRLIQAGDLFIALRGDARDGHDFIADAARQGAVAALVDRDCPVSPLPCLKVEAVRPALATIAANHRRQFKGTVIGITGSCGKTSTKDLLHRLLGEGETLATEANLNNTLGVPLTLLRIDPARHRYAVIEAGINQLGEMTQMASQLRPDLAIITSIGPAHLDGLESEANVWSEKSILIQERAEGGRALLPAELLRFETAAKLDRVDWLFSTRGAVSGVTYDPQRHFLGLLESENGRWKLVLTGPGLERMEYLLPQCSPGMRSNMRLAITAACRIGASDTHIQQVLDAWKPSPLRGEIRQSGEQLYYLDCYNANPVSMLDALAAFMEVTPDATPRFYVLGGLKELGPEEEQWHQRVGEAVPFRPQDRAILVAENAAAYRQGLLNAGWNNSQITLLDDAREAQALLADQTGAFFLKGSRAYRLENALPETLLTTATH